MPHSYKYYNMFDEAGNTNGVLGIFIACVIIDFSFLGVRFFWRFIQQFRLAWKRKSELPSQAPPPPPKTSVALSKVEMAGDVEEVEVQSPPGQEEEMSVPVSGYSRTFFRLMNFLYFLCRGIVAMVVLACCVDWIMLLGEYEYIDCWVDVLLMSLWTVAFAVIVFWWILLSDSFVLATADTILSLCCCCCGFSGRAIIVTTAAVAFVRPEAEEVELDVSEAKAPAKGGEIIQEVKVDPSSNAPLAVKPTGNPYIDFFPNVVQTWLLFFALHYRVNWKFVTSYVNYNDERQQPVLAALVGFVILVGIALVVIYIGIAWTSCNLCHPGIDPGKSTRFQRIWMNKYDETCKMGPICFNYLTLPEDPTTSMIVVFHTAIAPAMPPIVFYEKAVPSASPSASRTPSATPSVTPSISESSTVSLSNTPSPSNNPSPSITPSATPSATPSTSGSNLPSPSSSATPSSSSSIAPSASSSASASQSLAPSASASATSSNSQPPSASSSSSQAPSASPSASSSQAPSASSSSSQAPSASSSSSQAPSASPSASSSQAPSASSSSSLAPSATPTPSSSVAPSAPGLKREFFSRTVRGVEDNLPQNAVTGFYRKIHGIEVERYVSYVVLDNLEPDTVYRYVPLYCVDKDCEKYYYGEEKFFRTVPASGSYSFVMGGDVAVRHNLTHEISGWAAAESPLFIGLGGDITYDNAMFSCYLRWDWLLELVENSFVTPAGLSIPVLTTIGNHEAGGYLQDFTHIPTFMVDYFPHSTQFVRPASVTIDDAPGTKKARGANVDFWAEAEGDKPARFRLDDDDYQPDETRQHELYHSHFLGDQATLLALDTRHVNPLEPHQSSYINATMSFRNSTWNMALYHVPVYPAHYLDGGPLVDDWGALFDDIGLDIGFENHEHCYKRSHLMRDKQPSENGTLYIGGGSWGVDSWMNPTNFSYIANAKVASYYLKVTFENENTISLVSRDENSQIIDSVRLQKEPGKKTVTVN